LDTILSFCVQALRSQHVHSAVKNEQERVMKMKMLKQHDASISRWKQFTYCSPHQHSSVRGKELTAMRRFLQISSNSPQATAGILLLGTGTESTTAATSLSFSTRLVLVQLPSSLELRKGTFCLKDKNKIFAFQRDSRICSNPAFC